MIMIIVGGADLNKKGRYQAQKTLGFCAMSEVCSQQRLNKAWIRKCGASEGTRIWL